VRRRALRRIRARTRSKIRSAAGGVAKDRGTGLVGTLIGVAIFLVLMLVAVQVAFDLYARAAVSAAASDAVRVVTGSDAGATPASLNDAEEAARSTLGAYGDRASFSWQVTADEVELTIYARNPSILPRSLVSGLGLDAVAQSAVVRRERVR
jgi:Flp pilus assembly protein TadG